jgi:hypothetical protein
MFRTLVEPGGGSVKIQGERPPKKIERMPAAKTPIGRHDGPHFAAGRPLSSNAGEGLILCRRHNRSQR